MINLKKKAFHSSLWAGVGAVTRTVVRIFVMMILARLLSPAQFGLFTAAIVFLGFCQLFMEIGMGPALVQSSNLNERHIETAFTSNLIFSSAVMIGVYFLAPVGAAFFAEPELLDVLRLCSLIPFIQGLKISSFNLLLRKFEFKKIAITEMISFIFGYGFVGIISGILGLGVWSLVLAEFSEALISTSTFLMFYHPPKRLRIHKKEFLDLFRFGVGMTFSNLSYYVSTQGDNLIVGRFCGAEALGFYSKAYQISYMPHQFYSTTIGRVIFPFFCNMNEQFPEFRKAYLRQISIVGSVTFTASIFCCLFASEIIPLLLGNQWSQSIPLFQILVFVLFFRVAWKVDAQVLRAMNRTGLLASLQGLRALAIISLALVWAPSGMQRVALGVALAILLSEVVMLCTCRKLLHIGAMKLLHAIGSPLLQAAIVMLFSYSVGSILRHYCFAPTVILAGAVSTATITILITSNVFERLGYQSNFYWIWKIAISNLKPA